MINLFNKAIHKFKKDLNFKAPLRKSSMNDCSELFAAYLGYKNFKSMVEDPLLNDVMLKTGKFEFYGFVYGDFKLLEKRVKKLDIRIDLILIIQCIESSLYDINFMGIDNAALDEQYTKDALMNIPWNHLPEDKLFVETVDVIERAGKNCIYDGKFQEFSKSNGLRDDVWSYGFSKLDFLEKDWNDPKVISFKVNGVGFFQSDYSKILAFDMDVVYPNVSHRVFYPARNTSLKWKIETDR